jgi:hypothetical protein
MSAQTIPRPVTPTVSHRASVSRRTSNPKVAWVPERQLEHPGWVEVGRRLGAVSRVSNWWVGDWLQYGAARWGEKYAEAARITGHDAKTLRNYAYVARQFDLSRRRDTLAWSHHAEVAGLEPREQDRWLDRALKDRLSVADLRTELLASQRSTGALCNDDGEAAQLSGPAIEMVCPHCGEVIPLAAGVDQSVAVGA